MWLKGSKSHCKENLSSLVVPMLLLSPMGLHAVTSLLCLVTVCFRLSALGFTRLWFAVWSDPSDSRKYSCLLPITALQARGTTCFPVSVCWVLIAPVFSTRGPGIVRPPLCLISFDSSHPQHHAPARSRNLSHAPFSLNLCSRIGSE